MRFTEVYEPERLAYATNHFAGWITDAVEVFIRQGTGEQLDKLADALTR
jgi:hypothetical protein